MKVRLNEARLRKIKGVQLRPGLQSVDDSVWAEIKKHPVGKSLMDRGALEEVRGKKPGKPSADDVAAEIPEIYDMKELEAMAKDNRKVVSDAAKAQIEKINATGA